MPKESLENQVTASGWTVTKKISTPLGSGGNFCARYEVESSEGKVAFLKAMDLASVMHDINRVKETVDSYIFEQNVLKQCAGQRMTKVVTPLDMGALKNPNFPQGMNTVYYIIFEMAEGDLRKKHLEVEDSERTWLSAFKALHHAAVGIKQLHKAEIAHQDIKPSNVLAFDNNEFKVSDLGRVVDKKGDSPFANLYFPGDGGYRPIEMFWGVSSDEFLHRLSCDMFMVGSLIYHLFEDVQINSVILDESRRFHNQITMLDYATALPFIMSAFHSILDKFQEKCRSKFGDKIANLLVTALKEMCHPDPALRGNLKFQNQPARLIMERYVGILAQVALIAQIQGIK